MKEWATEDWGGARDFVEAEPDPERQKMSLRALMGTEMDDVQRAEAVSWAGTLEPPLSELAMRGLVARSGGQAVADLAIAWLNKMDRVTWEADSQARSTLSITAMRLASEGPLEFTEWVARLPKGFLHEAAAASGVGFFMESDPAFASEWIANMPEGESRDLAIVHLIPAVADDPARAFAWSLAVSDPGIQSEQAASVLVDWWQRDPQAASAALEESSLTESLKAAIAGQLATPSNGKRR
ncbi:MAG: hypothetical protein KDN22_01395 [Verrucomicrobiae bacterium]|nr:hypothetical protein [Verrucomicrobiae bacterium]